MASSAKLGMEIFYSEDFTKRASFRSGLSPDVQNIYSPCPVNQISLYGNSMCSSLLKMSLSAASVYHDIWMMKNSWAGS